MSPTSSPAVSSQPGSSASNRARVLRRCLLLASPLGVVMVAWASTGVRDTMAIANVALVMAAVTVATAAISWQAGLATSIAAALSLNYFHTEPVHSLRVTSRADLLSIALLAAIGIAASTAGAMRVRAFAREHVATKAAEGRNLLATAGSTKRPIDVVWAEAVRAACAGLSLVDCRIEPVGSSRLPSIARQRSVVDEVSTFVLPDTGAVIPMRDPRQPIQVVLSPRAGMGSLELDRRAVVAFVDQLELVLTGGTTGRSDRGTL